MNDEFLTQYQPDVRPVFQATLRDKLCAAARKQRKRGRVLAATLAVLVMLSVVMSLPPVRAQVKWLIREIGGITFVETENPKEDSEAIRAAFSEDGVPPLTPSPSQLTSLSGMLELYPELADFLPTWVPDGFVIDDMAVADVERGGVAFFWVPVDVTIGIDDVDYPWISFQIDCPCELPLPVVPDLVQEITIGDTSAALWERIFVGDRNRYPEERIYSLAWRQNGLQYGINWREPGLTLEDVLRMAESIPETALPIDPEHFDDLIYSMKLGEYTGVEIYIIRLGDNVHSIAERFNLEPETIVWSNTEILGLAPWMVSPGMTVFILPVDGVYHTVKAGETAATIAAMYEVSPEVLYNQWNKLGADAKPQPGQRLVIPGGIGEEIDYEPPPPPPARP